jgi:ABC-2 type transport system ATP-binding protein
MSGTAIEVQDLHKTYARNHGSSAIHAVDGVSFEVQTGEVFSLLGPNGAGKTTTISILSCLLRPDGGDALVFGHSLRRDPQAVKALLGVVPQDIALYDDLSARENLVFWGKMYGLGGAGLRGRVDEVLEVIGLSGRQNERVGRYSGGMKRRVNIGVALLHKPRLIYMDEPTVGIDPQSRRSILDSVVALKEQGTTVLYTTHYMEEAQELSDHIAIMDQGRVIASGTHAGLVRMVGELDRIRLTINAEAGRVIEAWQATPGVKQVSAEDGTLTLLADDSNRVLPRLFEASASLGVRITTVDIQEPNLESVFLSLTGRALRD